jgi:hypothetical protein
MMKFIFGKDLFILGKNNKYGEMIAISPDVSTGNKCPERIACILSVFLYQEWFAEDSGLI